MTKKKARELALQQWWDRSPWPCMILSADPGKEAGAALLKSGPGGLTLIEAREIDTYTSQVEEMFDLAIIKCYQYELPLVLVLEDWGAGGRRGITQWIGLGEQRGAWRRAHMLLAGSHKLVSKTRIAYINQNRWRSRVVPETGVREPQGFRRFTPEEWKGAAYRAAIDLLPDAHVPNTPNAPEAVCMAVFGARSDEVGKKLPPTYLRKHGVQPYEPLEHRIRGKK